MSNSLSQVMTPEQFSPTSVEEYLALQLAKRLRDEAAIERYIRYAEHHPAVHLVHLFHRVKGQSDPADAFHSSLASPDL